MDIMTQRRNERGRLKRRERLAAARLKGTHTKGQWEELKAEFDGRCVRCGEYGWHLDQDHIVPIYQGGSDSIENIQPLCACCNAQKGPEDMNWKEYRRIIGFEDEATEPTLCVVFSSRRYERTT